MFFEEVIFKKSEVEQIIKYSENYTDLSSYPKDEIKQNNRIEYISDNFTKLYTTYSIPVNIETQWLFIKLRNWFELKSNVKLKQYTSPDSIVSRILTLQKYSVGDRFDKHFDITNTPPYNNRRFNLGVSLNNSYEGGEYMLYFNEGEEYTFSTAPGNAIGYDISYLHEVKEVTRGERWSLVYPLYKGDFIEGNKLL